VCLVGVGNRVVLKSRVTIEIGLIVNQRIRVWWCVYRLGKVEVADRCLDDQDSDAGPFLQGLVNLKVVGAGGNIVDFSDMEHVRKVLKCEQIEEIESLSVSNVIPLVLLRQSRVEIRFP
jgi:hypothetical protein